LGDDNLSKHNILKAIYGKYNELESLKKYINDENAIKIIEAKQDTLDDVEEMIKQSYTVDDF
jgi:hypothetical protein